MEIWTIITWGIILSKLKFPWFLKRVCSSIQRSNTINPKKIFFLCTQMAIGGAQKVMLSQAKWFHDRGYQVVAAFLYDKEGLKEQWAKTYLFEVLDFDFRKSNGNLFVNMFKFPFGILRLFRYLRRNQFEVIETFTLDSNLIGIPLGFLAGVPVRIPTVHGILRNRPKLLGLLHGKLVNSKLTSTLVVVSNRVKQEVLELEKINTEKIEVILNGIQVYDQNLSREEAKKQLGLSQNERILINLARLDPSKGQSVLIDAIPSIRERFPNIQLLIAGDGELRKSLETQITDLGLTQNIHLLGTRQDIYPLLRAADIFVLPSLWEGLPIALLEAMAAACPVIVTNVEGIDDVVQNKKNGIVIPINDRLAISNAVVDLLADERLRESLGRSGKQLVEEKFSIEAMCQQYEQLFASEA